jgi:hypothetical protein
MRGSDSTRPMSRPADDNLMRPGDGRSVSRDIAASADELFSLIADVTRVGDWSPECRSARWLDGATHAETGARFRGVNRWGLIRWSRVCEVTVAEPGRRFAFRTVATRLMRDSTLWRFELEPLPGGDTRVIESYEIVLPLPKWMQRWMVSVLLPHHFDMRPHMASTLHRLAAATTRSP